MPNKYLDQIIQGDCLDLLNTLSDNSIDVSFADPPFNLRKKYNSYRDSLEHSQYLDWCKLWITELVRVTKPTGSIFIHNIPRWLTYYANYLNPIADFKHWISWDAPTAPMGKTLQPSHYGILFYAKDAKVNKFYEIRYPHKRCRKCGYLLKDYGGKKASLHPFGPLASDVWSDIHRIRHNKYRDNHPCQLPVHLLERIILMSSDEGDMILDPFIGTGTTAIAAKRLGRRYIGFDIDERYANITKSKIDQEETISKINDCWLSYYLQEPITIKDKDWSVLSDYFILPDDVKKIDLVKIKLNNNSMISRKNKKRDLSFFTP